jgi:hypothetical protein
MIGKRGIRRASMRVRLAVAAAVLVGGGAAAVVGISVSHGSGTATAESAGYYTSTGQTLSFTSAMSSAMKEWNQSSTASLTTITKMQPLTNYWTQSWHHTTIVIQRGVVVAVGKNEFAVKSADGKLEVWHANSGTKFENVGDSKTGWNAMSGGTMSSYGDYNWSNTSKSNWNTSTKALAKGDLVFVFGELEGHTLKAQLVLFAAPRTTVRPTPTATPTSTWTAPTAAPTSTATTPGATPAATSTNQFTGHNS